MSDEFYIYSVNYPNGTRRLVSPLPVEFTNTYGLISESTAGEFVTKEGETDSPEHFVPNPQFVAFLHWALAKHVPEAPGFKAQAEKDPNGSTYLMDIRGVVRGKEPQQEDLIAVIELKDGKAVEFKGHLDYKILTEQGFLRIEPWLRDQYLQELQNFVVEQKAKQA